MNKKLTIIIAIGLVIVAAAAFVGGRLLNGRGLGPLGFMPFGPGGGQFAMSVRMLPATELPKTPSDLTGTFVERKDNVLTIQSFPMNGESGGVVLSTSSGGDDKGGPVTSNSADMSKGPKTEVVVTGKTIIYRDSTEPPSPSSSSQETTIQQTVEAGTLNDLNAQSMIQVWGRKNGDRIIADVIVYSSPIMIQK